MSAIAYCIPQMAIGDCHLSFVICHLSFVIIERLGRGGFSYIRVKTKR